MTKNKKDFAPVLGDLRENFGMGPCNGGADTNQMGGSKIPTVDPQDRPDLTHPTRKQK